MLSTKHLEAIEKLGVLGFAAEILKFIKPNV